MQSLSKQTMHLKWQQFWRFCHSRQMKHAIKTAIAAVICLILYKSAHLPKGYWAVITAIVVMQSTADTGSLESTFRLAWHRLAGTMLGACIGLLIHLFLTPNYIELIGIIFILILVGVCITYFWPSMKLVGMTAVLVILVSGHEPMTQNIAFLRASEILIGALVALIISVVIWPQRMHQHLYQNYLKHMAIILDQFTKVHRAFTDRQGITPLDNATINELLNQIDSEQNHLDHLMKARRQIISNLLSWQIRLLKNIKLIYKNVGLLPDHYYQDTALIGFTEATLSTIQSQLTQIASGKIKEDDYVAALALLESYNEAIENYRLNKSFQRFSMNESYAVASIAIAINKMLELTHEIMQSMRRDSLK